jgi:hypothetical protein
MGGPWQLLSQVQGPVIGALLLLAACSKVSSPFEAVRGTVVAAALRRRGLTAKGRLMVVWRAIAIAEAAVGLAVLCLPFAVITGSTAAAFFASATTLVVWGVWRQRQSSCGCFGVGDTVSARAAARVGAITVLASAYAVGGTAWWRIHGFDGAKLAVAAGLFLCELVILTLSYPDLRRRLVRDTRLIVLTVRTRLWSRREQLALLGSVDDVWLWSWLNIVPAACAWSRPYTYKGWFLCDCNVPELDLGRGPEAAVVVVGRSLEIGSWRRIEIVRYDPQPTVAVGWDSAHGENAYTEPAGETSVSTTRA